MLLIQPRSWGRCCQMNQHIISILASFQKRQDLVAVIYILLAALSMRYVLNSKNREWKILVRVAAVASVFVIAGYVLVLASYVVYPNYRDHTEVTVASISWMGDAWEAILSELDDRGCLWPPVWASSVFVGRPLSIDLPHDCGIKAARCLSTACSDSLHVRCHKESRWQQSRLNCLAKPGANIAVETERQLFEHACFCSTH